MTQAARDRPFTLRPDAAFGEDRVVELLRTNDLVLISLVEAILAGEGIGCFVADQYMSSLEGSLGFLPRRVLVADDETVRARAILHQAGLEGELYRRDGAQQGAGPSRD